MELRYKRNNIYCKWLKHSFKIGIGNFALLWIISNIVGYCSSIFLSGFNVFSFYAYLIFSIFGLIYLSIYDFQKKKEWVRLYPGIFIILIQLPHILLPLISIYILGGFNSFVPFLIHAIGLTILLMKSTKKIRFTSDIALEEGLNKKDRKDLAVFILLSIGIEAIVLSWYIIKFAIDVNLHPGQFALYSPSTS